MKTILFTLLFLSSLQLSASSSQSHKKENVQKAMKIYVNSLIKENGFLPVVFKGKVLKLSLKTSKKYPDGFHSGVKNKGSLYTSCADFTDSNGLVYDIDFLVSKTKNEYAVVQPIVHSINGKKNKYDLGH